MSPQAVDREFSDTRRTLVAFLCFMAALIVLDAAGDPQPDLLMATFADDPWLAASLAVLLVAVGAGVGLIDQIRATHANRQVRW